MTAWITVYLRAHYEEEYMNEKTTNGLDMRLYYVPMITEIAVAKDGVSYERIVPDRLHPDHEDYVCMIPVIPGVTKIKFIALPDGVDHYYWVYSDDNGNESVPIGDGKNACVVTIPDYYSGGVTLYIEEGHRKVDFGNDIRNLYIKNGEGHFSLDIEAFFLMEDKREEREEP